MTAIRYFFNKRLFGNGFRRNWAITLLSSLVLFFAEPVAALLMFNNKSSLWWETSLAEPLEAFGDSLHGILFTSILLSAALGVLIALSIGAWRNKLPSSYFYNGLPLRREALLFTDMAVGAVSYLIASAVGGGLLILVTAVRLGSGALTGMILAGMARALLWFCVFYCGAWFAGSLSGLTVMQFLMTGALFYLIPVVYFTALIWIDTFSERLYADYYIGTGILEKLSPGIAIFLQYDRPVGAVGILLLILFCLVLIALTVLMTRLRETGRAERPLVFGAANGIIRYTLMALATVLFGLFFWSLGGNSLIWLVFGYLCGAVLSWMLMNVILHKSVRSMFGGRRGFGIFCIVMAVAVIALPFFCRFLDGYAPASARYVELMVSDTCYELRDPAAVAAVAELDRAEIIPEYGFFFPDQGVVLGEAVAEDTEIVYEYEDGTATKEQLVYDTYRWGVGGFAVRVVYHPAFGLPLAKFFQINVETHAALEEAIRTIADSPDFADAYAAGLDAAFQHASLEAVHPKNLPGQIYYHFTDNAANNEFGATIGEAIDRSGIAALAGQVSYDTFQRPCIGQINFWTNHWSGDGKNAALPIFLGDRSSDYLKGAAEKEASLEWMTEKRLAEALEDWDRVLVMDYAGHSAVFEDKAQMTEILSHLVSLYHDRSFFTVEDTTYRVILQNDSEGEWKCQIGSYFLAGQIPAFVLEAMK